jgi:hypothetical protein
MSTGDEEEGDYTYGSPPQAAQDSPAFLQQQRLVVADDEGRETAGSVVLALRWQESLSQLSDDEQFRIVVLHEPPADLPQIESVALAWAPAKTIEAGRRVTESAALYYYGQAEKPLLSLKQNHLESLRDGSLFGPVGIEDQPGNFLDVETGHIDLPQLIKRLLAGVRIEPYVRAARQALSAPAPAEQSGISQVQQAISRLISRAGPLMEKELPSEALGAVQLLMATFRSRGGALDSFERVRRFYVDPAAFGADLFLVRAFAEQPEVTAEVARMRDFLRRALAPNAQAEMALDRRLAWELLSYAAIATRSYNRPSAMAAYDLFHRRYRGDYRNHHHMYWRRMAILNRRLSDVQVQAQSLRRLNTLRELGLPVGIQVLTRYEALLAESTACPRADDPLPGPDDTCCPDCDLAMNAEVPQQQAEEVLEGIGHSLRRQLARLSSASVRQILARSDNPRVAQFLRVVQASQLSSLAEILDDALLRYLRRFLLESRIQNTLAPLLDSLEQGDSVSQGQAERTLRTVSRLLGRSTRAERRALPPPAEETGA